MVIFLCSTGATGSIVISLFVVGATANRLETSVAGPIYVTKSLSLDLSLGFHVSDIIIRLARVLGTLS